MASKTKICGLKTIESVATAVAGGAAFVGFNFYPPSPRAVSPRAAAGLIAHVPDSVASVGLFVDPDDTAIDAVLPARAADDDPIAWR